MRKTITGSLLAAALVLGATPASAASQRVYFECSSTVGNLGGDTASWNTTPPAESFTEGGGCGYVDSSQNGSAGPVSVEQARFAGTYTGTLGSLNIRLDTIPVGSAQVGEKVEFDLTLSVDGRDALGGARRVSVQPVIASSGRFHSYYLSVVGLPYTTSIENRQHTVQLTADIVNQTGVAWIYGAREVPSGLDFNPAGTHPTIVHPPGFIPPPPAPEPAPEPEPAPSASPSPSPSPRP